ncbi:MAG: (2Fe-2S)-binding protein [Bacillota bacterium]
MEHSGSAQYEVCFEVNGQQVHGKVPPTKMLVDFLRYDLGLTGTKKGCGTGECGACTVLLNGKPVNSCLVPVVRCNGSTVMTIEGISKTELFKRIQEVMVQSSAFQCGFCAPGMMVSLYALFVVNSSPSEQEIRNAISGNLCRCSGYTKIVDSAMRLAKGVNLVGSR